MLKTVGVSLAFAGTPLNETATEVSFRSLSECRLLRLYSLLMA